jgi:hypothetical protein
MRAFTLGLVAMLAATAAAEAAPERRCGWLHNPTPGNHWLTDRDGQWILSAQGGPELPGMDRIPDMTTREWVRTNGYYGYGCACVTMEVNRAQRRVLRVTAAEQLPLSRCRADSSLPRPG